MDFSRNYLFINDNLQARLKECRVLIIGVGLGSVIAESLVRIGVCNLGICDGDVVAESNLNRQNYTFDDVDKLKVEQLQRRLVSINPSVNLKVINHYVDETHMRNLIPTYDFVVNTIDFDSPAFFSCHEICREFKKTEFFPMNLGFGCGLFVFKDHFFDHSFSKEKIVDHIVSGQTQSKYMKDKFAEYLSERREYDPQLIVGALCNSAFVCTLLCKILRNERVTYFPEFYFCDFKSA